MKNQQSTFFRATCSRRFTNMYLVSSWRYNDGVRWRNGGVIMRCTLRFQRALRGLSRAIRTSESGNFESETWKGQSQPTSLPPIHSIWPAYQVWCRQLWPQDEICPGYNFSKYESRPATVSQRTPWSRLRRCIATINRWTDYCNNREIIARN